MSTPAQNGEGTKNTEITKGQEHNGGQTAGANKHSYDNDCRHNRHKGRKGQGVQIANWR